MDTRDWHTFITVVNEGNITKAAERLFLSQPALSYRLRHLESELNRKLLLRSSEGIILTPEGELFFDYCKDMVRAEDKLQQDMSSISGKIQGTLKIASSINFADYELPKLLHAFRASYPDVQIEVKTTFSYNVSKMHNNGECMVAFARGDYKGVGRVVTLLEEPYCLVYKDNVSYKELKNIPFIRYNTDPSVSNVIETWCSENLGNAPMVAMDVNSMVTCRHFVTEGLGWSILTYMGLGSCKDRNIVVKPILDVNGKQITRNTSMFYTDSVTNLVAVKTFIDYVTKYYSENEIIDTSFFAT